MGAKIKIIVSILFVSGILLLSGCGCKETNTKKYSLSLEIWGTLDNSESLNEIFTSYRRINPNISNISYKKISADTYKKELLEALASGQGPDIFLINNTWLSSFSDKIVPAPENSAAGIINEQKFRNNFVDVAAADFVDNGKIYAVPLSVNPLILYYNKDLFNQAGISAPPRNWNEFIDYAVRLREINAVGEITRAGAAVGTAYNINRSTDILNLLMLQNGTNMVLERGRVGFDGSVATADGRTISPGENALKFYTSFANSGSSNYTWNSRQHYSIDAFSEGRAAMMFNYPWHMKTVSDKAPKLNFAVASVPQFENSPRINVASYWGFAVAKNKIPKSAPYGNSPAANISNDTRIGEAWLFITYLTTKPDGTFSSASSGTGVGQTTSADFDPAKDYLEKSGEPAARRDLIEAQKNDPVFGAFISDNLIARSWRKNDPESVDAIFAEMIDQVNRNGASALDALKTAAKRVQGL